jgi:hypothetical protein
MSTNGAGTSKAPAPHPGASRHDERGLVKVQPARLQDLQPKYASRIEHDEDNPDAHGWYSQLSMSPFPEPSHRIA